MQERFISWMKTNIIDITFSSLELIHFWPISYKKQLNYFMSIDLVFNTRIAIRNLYIHNRNVADFLCRGYNRSSISH